jgi:glutathione S-transferase
MVDRGQWYPDWLGFMYIVIESAAPGQGSFARADSGQARPRLVKDRTIRSIRNMLTLYYAPNTCALASHIALEQSGAEYQTRRIDFSRNEQRSAEFLRINPKGRVPALITDRGVLTETQAILLFICQSFPDASLAPLDDLFTLGQVNAFNSYLSSTVHVAHAHRLRGNRWADDEAAIASMRKKVPESVGECFEVIERDMFVGPWVMGPTYSISDIYLFTLSNWLESDGVDPARFPKVLDHRQRMAEDDSIQKVMAEHSSKS